MRRSLAWLVALPLMLVGSQAAHVLAYRWVYPEAGVRLSALVSTGHGYMSLLPFVLGAAAAVTVVSLALTALDAARDRAARPLPAWAFALLPPLGWVLQEHLERWLYSGVLPWHEFAAPTFLPGLLLQLPFAALAYVAARLLLRSAVRVGRTFAAPRRPRLLPLPFAAPAVPLLSLRPALLASGPATRGPPLLAVG
ncbi:MAG TPA: hypothetical protein VHD91_06850 [Gaiellaceae bacterium]|nr:hypothetical protein [Gaiellaceae bacterium]